MVSNDLTAGGNDELAGYWGGFSGEVDGEVLGFLSPLFNGDEYHGNAVQVHFVGVRVVYAPRARSYEIMVSVGHRRKDDLQTRLQTMTMLIN